MVLKQAVSVLVLSAVAALAQFNQPVRVCGDLIGLEGADQVTVHLQESGRPGPALQTVVDRDGHFEFGAVDLGEYTLTVNSRFGAEITRTVVNVRPSMSPVEVRLADAHKEYGGPATVSLRRLTHPVTRAARKEFERAQSAHEKGEVEQTLTHYKHAVEVSPGYFEAWNNLGTQYLELRQFAEAQDALSQAAGIEPSAMVLSNLALAYLGLGRLEDSRLAAEASLRADRESPRAHLILGAALARLRRTREAVEHLTVAARELPEARTALERLRVETISPPGSPAGVE